MSVIATSYDWSGKRIPAGFFALLWSLDAVLSFLMVAQHGLELEANPAMRWVMESAGLFGFLTVKWAVLLFVLYLAPYMRRWLLWCACGVMAWPVYLGFLVN